MATLSHSSICQKHIIHTTKYYLKKVHALWRKPLHSEHTKIIWQYLIGYLFLWCSECSGFLFFLKPYKNAVLVIYHLRWNENNLWIFAERGVKTAFSFSTKWGDILIGRSKCVLHVNKEVINYDYEAYKSEEKERRKTNENQFKIQKSITKIKNKN